MTWPTCNHIELVLHESVLHVAFNRPTVRNAMNAAMVKELLTVCDFACTRTDVRVIAFRGKGGHFCAGGDVREMMALVQGDAGDAGDQAALAAYNRDFGRVLEVVDAMPQVTVAACEGAVMGGGFGLACTVDVTLAAHTAEFAVPEVSLGIVPAQIAPFLVRRMGFSQAQRLAVTGARISSQDALAWGLVHQRLPSASEFEATFARLLHSLRACAPMAVATTKALLRQSVAGPSPALLDEAAQRFAGSLLGPEGREGVRAFSEKRRPHWTEPTG